MLILLSPAKRIDIKDNICTNIITEPVFIDKAEVLVNKLKGYTIDELMDLMSISEKLARLNEQRFKQWQSGFSDIYSAQAICAFNGEVYSGIGVNNWTKDDFDFAQDRVRIISGLYGMLKPLDYISAYRLEMNTLLQINEYDNLYQFWKAIITDNINNQLNMQEDNIIVNLASNEYFKVINKHKLNKVKIITPIFKDFKNGDYKTISIYLKKARGLMTRFIVRNRITNIEQIKEFNYNGYYYNELLTKDNEWVFVRD